MDRFSRILLLGLAYLGLAYAAMGAEPPRTLNDELAQQGPAEAVLGSRPSAAPAKGAASPAGVIHDPAVRPVQYMAQHPNPNEPLGFSAAQFDPSTASAPAVGMSAFDEQEMQSFDTFESDDPDAPAVAASSGSWLRAGRWYTQQSVTYLNRSTSVKNKAHLATDELSAVLPTFRTKLELPLSYGYQPGVRSTFGRFLGRDARNRDHSAEFTYFGLMHWQNSDNIVATIPGSVVSELDRTGAVPVYNGSNVQSYAGTSNLNSYEFNYRVSRRLSRDQVVYTRDSTWIRQATPALLTSLFGGMRVMTVNEQLVYSASSALGNGVYNVLTYNNLVGLQGGGEVFFEAYDWRLGGRLKGGAFVNWCNAASQVHILDLNNNPLVPNRNEEARDHTLSFAGDISFIAAYQFRPNFGFRVNYDLMWVTNLALAQNQLTFHPTSPTQIADQHSLFYQGVGFGFELTH